MERFIASAKKLAPPGFRQSVRNTACVVAALAVTILPAARVAAIDYNTFCITAGDCSLYDPSGTCTTSSTDTTANGGGANPGAPTIVIDPGHSGQDIHDTDPQTGLYDHDYPNVPEITEVFTVAQKVQSQLQSAGYNVIMTKQSADGSVSFRQRADTANNAHADLALSIHDSHGTSWDDMYGSGDGGQVYVQKVGDYRQNTPGMGRGNQKVTFNDTSVAQKSQQYGQIFAQQRTQDEGHKVAVTPISFDGRAGLPAGNIPMVMLFSNVPWVYNEVGAPSGALSQSELDKYAQGIADSVKKAIPPNGGGDQSGGSGCCAGGALGVDGSTSGGDSGIWNSGVKPPYIVEEYAIEVLKDLAQKKGASEADAVTPQHVLALVAWARIEGGDIMNSSLFNLYNTGYSSPQLDAGAHTVNGLGSYKSFDAGVEATARTLASGHGGMVKVLLDPHTTAKQFAHAESYTGTSAYPGTSIWAGAAASDPAGYENNTWGPILQTVRSDYKGTAALIIGTPAFEEQDNKTYPQALQFNGSAGSADVSGSCSTTSTQSAQSIVQEALKLAWPSPDDPKTHQPHGTTPTPAYAEALRKYNPTNYTGTTGDDCGVFVSTVVRATGIDSNYPPSGTGAQWAYVVSHADKYDVQYNVTSMSDLQPGDILIVGGPNGAGGHGHTWIYVGKQPGGYWSASASLYTRAANLTNDQLTDPLATGKYMRVRVK